MVVSRDVEYTVDDETMIGRLAVPDGNGRHPGVLIAHEGNGLDEFQKGRAEQLAGLGYVAFALDYYGGGRPLDDPDEMMRRLGALGGDLDKVRRHGLAGLEILLGEPRTDGSKVAAIGYCFGATVVLELARTGAEVAAVVGFHPGLNPTKPGADANIVGRVLMCVGADDPIIPPERRQAFEAGMREGGVRWAMHLYGGVVHSFTHPRTGASTMPGLRYDERADRESWAAMLRLFDEVFTDDGS
ncbi:MAG: dienelactone hydrolase family protein [Acidimicrobiales bacterium]